MPDGGGPARIRIVDGLAEVPAAAWDACAGSDNPFLSHAFLEALEASGSATAKTGWLPQHVLVEDAKGRLLAAAPLYLKSHSQGEYVFDQLYVDEGHCASPLVWLVRTVICARKRGSCAAVSDLAL